VCGLTLLSASVGHFFAKVCNAMTHQPIELENCSNHLRIQQVFWLRMKKIFFVLGLGFSVGDATITACFCVFDQLYPALGANPKSHCFDSIFFGN